MHNGALHWYEQGVLTVKLGNKAQPRDGEVHKVQDKFYYILRLYYEVNTVKKSNGLKQA